MSLLKGRNVFKKNSFETACGWATGNLLIFIIVWNFFSIASGEQTKTIETEHEPTEELIKEMIDHARKINDYFANAVRVYILTGEENAQCAASAAAKVAGRKQRKSMTDYLYGMAGDFLDSYPQKDDGKLVAMRLLSLKEEIEEKDWDLEDIKEEKAKLFKVDPEYCLALDRADPNVFVRRHPKLFRELK
jgi:hypothetical protein